MLLFKKVLTALIWKNRSDILKFKFKSPPSVDILGGIAAPFASIEISESDSIFKVFNDPSNVGVFPLDPILDEMIQIVKDGNAGTPEFFFDMTILGTVMLSRGHSRGGASRPGITESTCVRLDELFHLYIADCIKHKRVLITVSTNNANNNNWSLNLDLTNCTLAPDEVTVFTNALLIANIPTSVIREFIRNCIAIESLNEAMHIFFRIKNDFALYDLIANSNVDISSETINDYSYTIHVEPHSSNMPLGFILFKIYRAAVINRFYQYMCRKCLVLSDEEVNHRKASLIERLNAGAY